MPTYKIVFNPDWPNTDWRELTNYPDEYVTWDEAHAILQEKIDTRYKGKIKYKESSPGHWLPDVTEIWQRTNGWGALGDVVTIYNPEEELCKQIKQLVDMIRDLEIMLEDKQEQLDKLKAKG